MRYIAVDLGTTNIKVAVFDSDLKLLGLESAPVRYVRDGDCVEFDAGLYYRKLLAIIRHCAKTFIPNSSEPAQIVLTGQAESLVVCGRDGTPLRNGISWLDSRSADECRELQSLFDKSVFYAVTGQVSLIPTWPATKILFLKRHEPEVFERAEKILLLKDFIILHLTGELCGEHSIYNFSFYFDVRKKKYWQDMLDCCEMKLSQLPPLIEPCTVVGRLTAEAAKQTGLGADTTVNVGALDHFAGMVGTGNVKPGIISESTGTVMTIATLAPSAEFCGTGIPFHVGALPGSYVLMAVCESGGVCLEWFRNTFLPKLPFDEINRRIAGREFPNDLIFLPGIAGVNAPAYDERACGVFYGLKLKHDHIDMAWAVMEGVAHLLAENIESFRGAGLNSGLILSTGGGARSGLWCQMKADITNLAIAVPEVGEAACMGAAIIGAVSCGRFPTYEAAIKHCITISKKYTPKGSGNAGAKYSRYKALNEKISQ